MASSAVFMFEKNTGEKLSFRDIMKKHGEDFFRKLESAVLKKVIGSPKPLILAVGGGTPMLEENRKLLKQHLVIHISAPKSIVFERIMINGKPAFFPKDQDPFVSFQNFWNEREPVFEKMADITVFNTGSVDKAVLSLINQLPKDL